MPMEPVDTDWVRRSLRQAFYALPQEERALIVLVYWSGMSLAEIAIHLGMPLATVKTATRAALARLADLLDDEALRRDAA